MATQDHGPATSLSAQPVHAGQRLLADLVNEFASVRLILDLEGNGPRLLIQDLESDSAIYLCPLELVSLTEATQEDRDNWLRVGPYRSDRGPANP